MFGGPRSKDLPRVQRRPAGPGHTMGPGRLSNRIDRGMRTAAPDIHRHPAIHVLVVHGKFQRLGRDVDLVAAVKLDRQRVHVAQPVDRQGLHRSRRAQIGPHIRVQPVKAEPLIPRHGKRIAVEIHEHPPPRRRFPRNRQIDKAGPEVEHPRRME
ncbi:MAG: hypothetical protein C0427_16645, partial [Rhodobacter sp.]|nr:hypothetical protein [Rhodobacter sp.]